MAVIKLGTTSSANRLISYCEKRATEREGVLCDPEYVKSQFKATRSLWGKEDGIQAHHIIMSFPPYVDNMKEHEVAQAGKELAEKLAPGHEAAIFVHTDKDHWHAHIVINAVNHESGKKLHLSPKDYFQAREMANEICKERGWHVIEKPYAAERYTLAEREIIAKGQSSWKDELRSWIREGQQYTQNINELKEYLKKVYGVEMKIQEKNVSFLHPQQQKFVRGKTLGEDFTKEGLKHGYELERTSETTRTARQFERTNERVSTATRGINQADRFATPRIEIESRQSRDFVQQSEKNRHSTGAIIFGARQTLENIAKQYGAGTERTSGSDETDSKQLESPNLQQQRENTNVHISGSERLFSGPDGTSLVKAILNQVENEIKRIEASKEQQQKANQLRVIKRDREQER